MRHNQSRVLQNKAAAGVDAIRFDHFPGKGAL